MYDSLKRLIRARNPEQDTNTNLSLSDPLTGNSAWSLKYVYDENSNLLTRTDAKGTINSLAEVPRVFLLYSRSLRSAAC